MRSYHPNSPRSTVLPTYRSLYTDNTILTQHLSPQTMFDWK